MGKSGYTIPQIIVLPGSLQHATFDHVLDVDGYSSVSLTLNFHNAKETSYVTCGGRTMESNGRYTFDVNNASSFPIRGDIKSNGNTRLDILNIVVS